MTTDLDAIGLDLTLALSRRIDCRRRVLRRVNTTVVALATAAALCATAFASGIADDLGLDPTKWAVIGSGSTDGGQAAYVHARSLEDGADATFLVEHDARLPRYEAFRLHERTLAAAQASSPVATRVEQGELCSPAELTRAEQVALGSLATTYPGAASDAGVTTVDDALAAAFAGAPCRGLAYAGEQARLVYAGIEPRTMLMPGAR